MGAGRKKQKKLLFPQPMIIKNVVFIFLYASERISFYMVYFSENRMISLDPKVLVNYIRVFKHVQDLEDFDTFSGTKSHSNFCSLSY